LPRKTENQRKKKEKEKEKIINMNDAQRIRTGSRWGGSRWRSRNTTGVESGCTYILYVLCTYKVCMQGAAWSDHRCDVTV
jgi:hypothetical protein